MQKIETVGQLQKAIDDEVVEGMSEMGYALLDSFLAAYIRESTDEEAEKLLRGTKPVPLPERFWNLLRAEAENRSDPSEGSTAEYFAICHVMGGEVQDFVRTQTTPD